MRAARSRTAIERLRDTIADVRDDISRRRTTAADRCPPSHASRYRRRASTTRTLERLDDVVARSRAAADAFRRIDDQETVDRIVWALVVAGLQHAVELARLAMDEVGFGVFEDKVVKNYIATEFLYDYLKDKRSVGVIDEDVERAIRYVAEPIGVVLALTPITNPTSTILFKAIVAAKTRNAIIFRPSARAAGCSLRAVEILREAGERAGMPPDALQVIPDPTLDVSQYLFHHPDVDFIWTTGGPKAVAAANAAGKPCLSVGAGNAPVYIHRTADVPMAAVDMLISKTFDASLICPAEQTVIVDEPVWDETLAELQRLGARLLSRRRGGRRSPPPRSTTTATSSSAPSASRALRSARRCGFHRPPRRQGAARAAPVGPRRSWPPPSARAREADAGARAGALARRRARGARRRGRARGAAAWGTRRPSTRPTSPSSTPSRHAIRTGRILVNAPTAVGALGGVYNAMTPTFSLGCGTWGGSVTTDNINYRNLLNIKAVSRRQTPPQWFRVPSDTYFNLGSLDALRQFRGAQALARHRCRHRGARRGRPGPRAARRRGPRVLGDRAGADRGAGPRWRRDARPSSRPT